MDRKSQLEDQFKNLAEPGRGQPNLNAWRKFFLAEQSAIKGEALAVLNGCDPARLEQLIQRSKRWPAMAETCLLATRVLELANTSRQHANNKAAHQERPCLPMKNKAPPCQEQD